MMWILHDENVRKILFQKQKYWVGGSVTQLIKKALPDLTIRVNSFYYFNKSTHFVIKLTVHITFHTLHILMSTNLICGVLNELWKDL